MQKKLFEGIRIADFGWVATGPLTTKYFADLGAEVIKVESAVHLDTLRIASGAGKGVNQSPAFNFRNTGRLSVTINIATPKGKEIAKSLVAKADIVSENMGPGSMERAGLGYEELKKIKPDIIMLSSCMQGHTGPHFGTRGFGNVLAALSGLAHLTGWPDREPPEIGNYTDLIGPHFNAMVILAALIYRRRTGKGQYMDISQYEQGIQFIAPILLDYKVNQRVANRMGNRLAYAAPHNAYRCRGEDRWCAIAVFTDEEWESFCKVIGSPAWTKDPRFSTLLARKRNEEELDRLVEEWTINYTPEEVMSKMQRAGVPAGVLQTGEDLLEHDPQLKHRHFFWEVDHPEVGKSRAYRYAFVLSKAPYEVRRAPLLGEHNRYVFKEILGMSDDEIAELAIEGVLK